jgi:hypothetical protein
VRFVIEFEPPGDSSALFRGLVAAKLIEDRRTAAQTHILVGTILQHTLLEPSAKKPK